MAKPVKAATTRIASTVTARYTPASGATDAFYLDGRISGRREQRAADISLDREDRGFFFAVFAHTSGTGADETATGRAKRALDRMHQTIKQVGRNIDSEINELADTAVEVAGRITLQHDSVKQPYFAGVVVRDSELAAITMGGGCAYLYRNDVLYPLTTDDFPLEPTDRDGNPVERLNIYCAGVAGTVRYSNIAQLQVDDCVIVCNRELMEAVGQREMLRLLDEAEDQCDAAGLIMTAASAKTPGASLQFMISFVEGISTVDRPGRFGNGRATTDSVAAIPSSAKLKSFSEEPLGDALKTDTAPIAAPLAREDRRTRQQPADSRRDTELPFDDSSLAYEDVSSAGRGKRIAFYSVIALVCIACIFAIYSMLFKPKTPGTTGSTTTAITTKATTGSTTAGTSTASTNTSVTSTTVATTTNAAGLPAKYTVVSGDTISSIATKYYGESTPALWDLIRKANNMTNDNLKIGQILTIPVKS